MGSLLSNRTNLLPSVYSFIKNSERVIIYSAFIKYDLLKQVISFADGRIKEIVVRWQVGDLVNKVSDLQVFDLCQDHNITLYRNEKLHAKCIVNENGSCILGSANFTSAGMFNTPNSNWEINTLLDELDFDSHFLLQQIIGASTLVEENWVEQMKVLLSDIEKPKFDVVLPKHVGNKDFLLSALPMTESPIKLYDILSSRDGTVMEVKQALHDAVVYKLKSSWESYEDFLIDLKREFKSNKFINAFVEFMKHRDKNYLLFTEACIWISQKCQDVPVPSRFTIRDGQIVQPLYIWCDTLLDEFNYDRKYERHAGSDTLYIDQNELIKN